MRHFIWVYTVCQSLHLVVTGMKRGYTADSNFLSSVDNLFKQFGPRSGGPVLDHNCLTL